MKQRKRIPSDDAKRRATYPATVRIPFESPDDLDRFYEAAQEATNIGVYVRDAVLARLDAEKEPVA